MEKELEKRFQENIDKLISNPKIQNVEVVDTSLQLPNVLLVKAMTNIIRNVACENIIRNVACENISILERYSTFEYIPSEFNNTLFHNNFGILNFKIILKINSSKIVLPLIYSGDKVIDCDYFKTYEELKAIIFVAYEGVNANIKWIRIVERALGEYRMIFEKNGERFDEYLLSEC